MGRAALPRSGWTRGENERRTSVFSCRQFSLVLLSPGSFLPRATPRLARARCCSRPEAPGPGRPPLIVVTPPGAGSVLWARTRLCFPCRGVKRSGLFFECQPVNPGGGHFLPCSLLLPSGHAAAVPSVGPEERPQPEMLREFELQPLVVVS